MRKLEYVPFIPLSPGGGPKSREIVGVGDGDHPAVPAGRGSKTIRVLQIGGWSKLTAFRRSFRQ